MQSYAQRLVDSIDFFPSNYILLISLHILLGINHAILYTFLLAIYRIHIYSLSVTLCLSIRPDVNISNTIIMGFCLNHELVTTELMGLQPVLSEPTPAIMSEELPY